MDIVLLKDVDNLGSVNEIVTVKPGYARNFLIPQGMALVANKANRNVVGNRVKAQENREAKMLNEFKAIADQIQSAPVIIKTKAGTSGKIFGSVTNVQVAAAIREAFGIALERKKVILLEEVKMLGSYTARVDLTKVVSAVVNFEVVAEAAAV